MDEIIKKLYKFGLHDTCITGIEVKQNEIRFSFSNGVYKLDASGKEISLTGKSTLVITVNNSWTSNPFDVLNIDFFSKNGSLYIDSEDIESIVKKEKLEIQNIYYSRFNNTILFDSGNSKGNYLIRVEYCVDVEYMFEDKFLF